jgi:hypothetical protein
VVLAGIALSALPPDPGERGGPPRSPRPRMRRVAFARGTC